MSVLYPVAASAEAALSDPKGFAAREREAAVVAGEGVVFVSEATGPIFTTEAAGRAAHAERLDVGPEHRWSVLRPILPAGKKARRVEPTMKDGRRWPAPDPSRPAPQWRLSVSYWRIGSAEVEAPAEAARKLRKKEGAEALDAATLRALARQPLQAVRPQQPLDIGLFETRPPEAPHIIMPDE